jgi:hypothetical protein
VFASSPEAKAPFTDFNAIGRTALATSRPVETLRVLVKLSRSAA